jgi:uncharacterized protein with GYD domain
LVNTVFACVASVVSGGEPMPLYVLMTKLSPAETARPGRREAGQAWKKKVQSVCPDIRWLAHYALLGPYDFMDIYEAPDADAAFKVSLLSREEGALVAESWPALAYESYLKIAETVEAVEVRKK